MIELGHGNCGYPWHGLYRASSNRIETPAGGDIEPPGSYPSTDVYGRQGDCFAVQIPGMPAVTTSVEDAADGKTWLNYGLISGHDRMCCGIDLGTNTWIAVADGKPWRISCALTLGTGVLSITATISRFGVFVDAPADQVITLSHSIAYVNHGSMQALVDDIKPGGMSALVGIARYLVGSRELGGVVELAFSLTAGTWSLNASTVIDYSNIEEKIYHDSSSINTATYKEFMNDEELIACLGCRYSSAGSIQRIDVSLRTYGISTWSGDIGVPNNGTGTGSGALKLLIGGASVREVAYTSSLTWHQTDDYSGPLPVFTASGHNSITVDGTAFSQPFAEASFNAHSNAKAAPFASLGSGRTSCVFGASGSWRGGGPTPGVWSLVKHSSTLYGASMVIGGSSNMVYWPLSGRVGSAAETTSAATLTHATEHPVTGQISRSSGLVCWV